MLTFSLWWFMIRAYYSHWRQVFLSCFKRTNIAFFPDKPKFYISFYTARITYLFTFIVVTHVVLNGNKRHNHIYKDLKHNSFSEEFRGLFSFSTMILSPTALLFSLLTLFEFRDKHHSSKNKQNEAFICCCFFVFLRECFVTIPVCWMQPHTT